MKQQIIIIAGLIALTGLRGIAYATELQEKRAQGKLQVAVPGTLARAILSRGEREAIVKAAFTAVHKSVQVDVHKRNGDKIPQRFWGEAIQKLRPLRVVNDRMNIMIVRTEDSKNERGLYVTNPISSYGMSITDPRFAAFESLSKPEDRSFGHLFRYHIRKKQRSTSLR